MYFCFSESKKDEILSASSDQENLDQIIDSLNSSPARNSFKSKIIDGNKGK